MVEQNEANPKKKIVLIVAVAAVLVVIAGLGFSRLSHDSSKISQNNPEIIEAIKKGQPLDGGSLKELLQGNSSIGHTSNSRSPYQMNFAADGTYIFRKSIDDTQRHDGKWWIEGDYLYTEKTVNNEIKKNKYQFYHIYDAAYATTSEFGDCAPPGEFCPVILIFQGNIFGL